MASPLGRFIQSVTVQPCIYWGGLEHSGYSNLAYTLIEEIRVRWDDMSELAREEISDESGSNAKLLVNQDLATGGYVMLGTLGDEIDVDLPDGMTIQIKNASGVITDAGTGKHRFILVDGEKIVDNDGEFITTEYHPKGLHGAFEIKTFSKLSEFRSTVDFIRTATL